MAGKIKLTYFDGRARGEIIRLCFAYGKKSFDDVRIDFAQWPGLKDSTPLGSLPIMEVGGKTFPQGIALANYAARECGLYGANNMENLVIDVVCQTREDMMVAESKFLLEQDPEKRVTLADIVIFEGTTSIAEQTPQVLDNYPEIKALREKVAACTGIKEYLAKRKMTPF